ncbi:hypothetical protein E2C01_097992 [Portunus trituberculatus]|uniref:Uncharacterized protein n=1 Tax=Portunus trituberculatus TaxID=210409 RepID=A0A5B7K1U0_PORTR|nr:hypothetical protein [Portunus trituberculatus]
MSRYGVRTIGVSKSEGAVPDYPMYSNAPTSGNRPARYSSSYSTGSPCS